MIKLGFADLPFWPPPLPLPPLTSSSSSLSPPPSHLPPSLPFDFLSHSSQSLLAAWLGGVREVGKWGMALPWVRGRADFLHKARIGGETWPLDERGFRERTQCRNRNEKEENGAESESESRSVLSDSWRHCIEVCMVHGILQARILEWVAFPFSRGSSQPRNQIEVSCTAGEFFTNCNMREVVWGLG